MGCSSYKLLKIEKMNIMKIVKIETFVVGAGWFNLVFVKVHTDEGITGIGEASLLLEAYDTR